MNNQIKAFHDNVKHSQLRETVMNHLKTLNREQEILSRAGVTGYMTSVANFS